MRCKCGNKSRVIDTIHSDQILEYGIVRLRKCTVCGRIFYTSEMEIEYDEDLYEILKRNKRGNYQKKSK